MAHPNDSTTAPASNAIPTSPNVVLCYPVTDDDCGRISATFPNANVINAGQERVAEALFEADIFCGHAKVPVPWDEVVKQGRLRWIQSSAAGLDHCLNEYVIASDIRVTSASGLFANQVAEQTLALLFGLVRKIPTFCDAMKSRSFERLPTDDLHGKSIGIVGLGGNGRRIAEFLAPLGSSIVATDWFPIDRPACVDELWGPDRLDELLACSDVVILCVPLTPDTHHMIDSNALGKMRPGSILINVARGPVVDESALIDSLQRGHLASAGVDVTEVEPLAVDSPLWDMPNVLITPHVGAQSARRVPDTTVFFCENMQRLLDGDRLINLVDKSLGFPERIAAKD